MIMQLLLTTFYLLKFKYTLGRLCRKPKIIYLNNLVGSSETLIYYLLAANAASLFLVVTNEVSNKQSKLRLNNILGMYSFIH